MILQNFLTLLLVLPFVGSVAAALLPASRNAEAWLAGCVAVLGLAVTFALYPVVANGGVARFDIAWLPSFGLNLTIRIDGLAWLFLVLLNGIGLLVFLYARYYLSPKEPAARLFAWLLAFMGAMGGILLSGNLVMLVVFWEMTSVFSFMLIGFWHRSPAARDGARMALVVTAFGGLSLLAGVLLIGAIVGSYDLDRVLASGDVLRAHPLYLPILILVLLGAFTKSAQFPFHFWLPNAMAAPTPVSSFLHSATLVKAGVFLLIRLSPALGGTEQWFTIVSAAGLITLLLGAFVALFQHDLKGLLAYSTISHLGLIVALIGMDTPLAIVAAIFHTVNHAVFKASLFMAAGTIDHETGTRDMRRLGGLWRAMPITGTLAIVASAAMAGVPLLNGFISKEMFFAQATETYDSSLLDRSMTWMALAAGILSVAYSIRFVHSVFFGPVATDLPKAPHEPPFLMRLPVEVLVVICLLVGIVPGLTIAPFLRSAAIAVLGPEIPYYSLAIWHGLNLPLVMSAAALAGGLLVYALLAGHIAAAPEGPPVLRNLKGQRIFDRLLVNVSWIWARRAFNLLGTERLQTQLRILVLVALTAATWKLWGAKQLQPISPRSFDPLFTVVWAVGAACAVTAAWQAKYHRFAALLLVGGAGLMTCASFVWLSAPDLAVTQLLVEIVTTVLLLLGLRWLPKRREEIAGDRRLIARLRRGSDLVIAVACGVGIAGIAYAVMTSPPDRGTADWFLRNAYAEGGGTNVVNVILVDFRGFDTFGEITVLGIVALTIFALLRRFRPAQESVDRPEQQLLQDASDTEREDRNVGDTLRDYLAVPSVIMRWMFPAIITLSAYLFLRGHDLPGGGFAAGITLAIAFLLQYLGSNVREVEDRLRILPVRWIGLGLIIAALTGFGSWLFGYPFLTSRAQYLEFPWIGKVPFATALFFDVGVYLLVVGATVLILVAIAHQSLRAQRSAETEEEG
ncbi:MAG: monovalent cation/H+ antiporter subunit A [Amaricoccus sp.]|uniref:monovalent cation/H+ antiporter subunit A n=1 Tax=Amaricoccus sp. TaxID=1872485 RepID=UPI0039E38A3B